MKYIIANWKANKNSTEVQEWITNFTMQLQGNEMLMNKLQNNAVSLIICPPFPFIEMMKPLEKTAPNIKIGAQTVSAFVEGAYTGEVTAKSLNGMVNYAIIGHSERRSHFAETDETLAARVKNAKEQSIEPIFCIRGTEDAIPSGVTMIAYEPVEAIGTGMNMPSAQVSEKKKVFTLTQGCIFIYGGSVNDQSAQEYLINTDIDGLLIGGASLKPESFIAIASKA
jgi:triosephosphate isomerase